jgi:hypothetical protein
MLQIAIISAHAPSARGGKYRRPVHVRVFDPEAQTTSYARQGRGRSVVVVAEWRNVDSRYDGERSAFGRAIREAQEIVGKLGE